MEILFLSIAHIIIHITMLTACNSNPFNNAIHQMVVNDHKAMEAAQEELEKTHKDLEEKHEVLKKHMTILKTWFYCSDSYLPRTRISLQQIMPSFIGIFIGAAHQNICRIRVLLINKVQRTKIFLESA